MTLTPAQKQAIRLEISRRESWEKYSAYVEYVHEGRWIPARAVVFLCDQVQDFVERPTEAPYEILIISVPPQHGKSMTVTETLPSWYLGKNPYKRIIEISYNETFAQLFGRRNKNKIEQFGLPVFGVELAKSPNNNTEFEIDNNVGGMISRGVMSGVTGRPADLMLLDDPIKNRQEADSETYRRRLADEWENSFKTRLSAGAKVILIQTRWHQDDLAGHIIRNEKNAKVINLPCIAEENDPLGRKPGQALMPEIGKDDKWAQTFSETYKTQSGSRAWNALYQGRPTSAEGNILKREWWQYYDVLPKMNQKVISVDATFKDAKDNDFVAIQVWGKRGPNCYLIYAYKGHLNFPATCKKILEVRNLHPDVWVTLIEDKANGSAIIQILRNQIPGIVPVNPSGGKVARANAVSGHIEGHYVYLPKNEPFTGDFVEECADFPNSLHDDQVDCMTQALNRLIYWQADDIPPKDDDQPDYDDQIDNFLNFGG
ncbi:phage terminase large subunit [Marasmitruncus massiliensis]|uniref:phage terminase large subunit n=1 Tax=Marasmitruncus massiliensis TaxID=1944642 RepID=UPI000C7E5F29|nr:phage terminase large subunit [Marasmitruncus massiliensis]